MYQELYAEALAAIYKRFGASDEDAQRKVVRALREPMRTLWDSFRTNEVRANYAEDTTQAAYLLRYYLPYSGLLPRVLRVIPEEKFPKAVTSVCLAGAGPCPEALGLALHLREANFEGPLRFTLVDQTDDSWAFARSVTFDRLIPAISRKAFRVTTRAVGLDLASASPPAGEFDLLVFQNCFNEIVGKNRFDHAKLRSWARSVRPGGLMVLIDRADYPHVTSFMRECTKELATAGMEQVAPFWQDQLDARPMGAAIPAAVLGSLLYFQSSGWIDQTDQNNKLHFQRDINFLRAAFRKTK